MADLRVFSPVITAHQAFLTNEALNEIARVTTENLLCLAEGKPFLGASVLVKAPAT